MNLVDRSPSPRAVDQALPAGQAIKYRVQAIDRAGNVGAWTEGAYFTPLPYQESNVAIRYAGVWTTGSLTGAYGERVKFGSSTGASATFAMPVGTRGVSFVSTKAADRGRVDIYLDGKRLGTVDLYSSATQLRQTMFARVLDPAVAHTLEVRVLGTKHASSKGTRVDVDAIVRIK